MTTDLQSTQAQRVMWQRQIDVMRIFIDHGYSIHSVLDERSIQVIEYWVRLGLAPEALNQWLESIATAVQGRPPRLPVIYLEERVLAELTGKSNSSQSRSLRMQALEAAGVNR